MDALCCPSLSGWVGWIHRIAFIAYVVTIVAAFITRRDVRFAGWLRSFVAAFVPFGTFINDPWVKRLGSRQMAAVPA